MTKIGEHITLDIIGTEKEYTPQLYEKVIRKIADAAKVTILNIYQNINLNHTDLQFLHY